MGIRHDLYLDWRSRNANAHASHGSIDCTTMMQAHGDYCRNTRAVSEKFTAQAIFPPQSLYIFANLYVPVDTMPAKDAHMDRPEFCLGVRRLTTRACPSIVNRRGNQVSERYSTGNIQNSGYVAPVSVYSTFGNTVPVARPWAAEIKSEVPG